MLQVSHISEQLFLTSSILSQQRSPARDMGMKIKLILSRQRLQNFRLWM